MGSKNDLLKSYLKDYKPINYNNWELGDRAREGINLINLGLVNSKELEIWKEAVPYQDQRDDPGQAELVTYFALKILNYIKADRNIVVPAAMMHDIGFYKTDVNEWKNSVKTGQTEGEMKRRPHQNRGIGLAGRILEKVGYPEEYHFPIFDIIGDHDTRLLPTTVEGQIVRDADMLWRITYPCSMIYHKNVNAEELLDKFENPKNIRNLKQGVELEPNVSDLSPIALEIARIEVVNTMRYRFPKEAEELLKDRGYRG